MKKVSVLRRTFPNTILPVQDRAGAGLAVTYLGTVSVCGIQSIHCPRKVRLPSEMTLFSVSYG
jgi:hypothetical protein